MTKTFGKLTTQRQLNPIAAYRQFRAEQARQSERREKIDRAVAWTSYFTLVLTAATMLSTQSMAAVVVKVATAL